MNRLSQMIKEDMKPALGVTEPGAIAFAAAKARSYTHGPIEEVLVAMNSGMYKNAFTCGIPNSDQVGNIFSAALGVVAGDSEKGLEALANVTAADNETAQRLVEEGRVHVKLSGITSEIFIEATVKTACDECVVTIKGSHTNIVRILVNGRVELEVPPEEGENLDGQPGGGHEIHGYTLAQLVDYAKTVPLEEIQFIREAYTVNLALLEEGLSNPRTTFAPQLKRMNRGQVISAERLFESVWGENYLDRNNTVMVHIRRLREKMGEPSRNPRFIKTVWGVGYKID